MSASCSSAKPRASRGCTTFALETVLYQTGMCLTMRPGVPLGKFTVRTMNICLTLLTPRRCWGTNGCSAQPTRKTSMTVITSNRTHTREDAGSSVRLMRISLAHPLVLLTIRASYNNNARAAHGGDGSPTNGTCTSCRIHSQRSLDTFGGSVAVKLSRCRMAMRTA